MEDIGDTEKIKEDNRGTGSTYYVKSTELQINLSKNSKKEADFKLSKI